MAEQEKPQGEKVQGRVIESSRDKLSLEGELTSQGLLPLSLALRSKGSPR